MWIEKININGFGKLKKKDIEFSNGLNIVFGENESGKSTVQSFIKNMFYSPRKYDSSKFDNGNLISCKPLDNERFGGCIEYYISEKEKFRIERDFENNELNIFDSLYNNITQDFDSSKDLGPLFASSHLGIDFNTFKNSVLVEQADLRIGSTTFKELIERVLDIARIGVNTVNFDDALKCLSEELKVNVGTSRTKKRPLDLVIKRIEDMQTLKEKLMKKRECALIIEGKKNEILDEKRKAESSKQLIIKIREIMFSYDKMNKKKVILNSTKKLIDSLSSNNEELMLLFEKEKSFEELKQKLKVEDGDEDESNRLILEYFKINELKNRIKQNNKEMDKINSELIFIEENLEKYKKYSQINDIQEHDIVKYFERQQNNKEDKRNFLKKFLDRTSFKLLIMYTSIILVTFVTMILQRRGYYYVYGGVFVTLLVTVIIDHFMLRKINIENRENDSNSLKMINSIQINSIQEYLQGKDKFSELESKFMNLNDKIEMIESNNVELEEEINNVRSLIIQKLKEVGIKIEDKDEYNNIYEKVCIYNNMYNSYKNLLIEQVGRKSRIESISYLIKEILIEYSEEFETEVNNIDEVRRYLIENKKEFDEIKTNMVKDLRTLKNYKSELVNLNDLVDKLSKEIIGNKEFNELSTNIETKYTNIEKKINNLESYINEFEYLSKSVEEIDDNILEIDLNIKKLIDEKNELEGYATSLKTAMEVLNSSSDEFKREIVPKLCLRVSEILGKITKGRYEDIKIDNKSQIKIKNKELETVLGLEYLSGGTIDQIFLAIRIAVGEFISQNNGNLPLILDEIFIHYDDTRTLDTLRYIVDVSKDKQVVLFTCKRRELELLESITPKFNLINI